MVPVSEFLKSVKIGLKLPLFVNTFLPATSKPDELEINFFFTVFLLYQSSSDTCKKKSHVLGY